MRTPAAGGRAWQHAGFVLNTLARHPYQDSTKVEDEGALLADLIPTFDFINMVGGECDR